MNKDSYTSMGYYGDETTYYTVKKNGKYVECKSHFFLTPKATDKFRRQYAEYLREMFEMGIPVTYGSDSHKSKVPAYRRGCRSAAVRRAALPLRRVSPGTGGRAAREDPRTPAACRWGWCQNRDPKKSAYYP